MPAPRDFADPPDLSRLAYCSVLTSDLTPDAIASLIGQAQHNNAQSGITGQLMIDQNLVIQWIEGPKVAIDSLWQRLQADTRHHCLVQLLHAANAPERVFAAWAMRRATRQEMIELIKQAQMLAATAGPWSAAIGILRELVEPTQSQATARSYHPSTPHPSAPS